MTDVEIKPCPFCGSKVKLFDNKKDFTAEETSYGIRCTNRRCGMYITFYPRRTSKKRLIAAWNDRIEE